MRASKKKPSLMSSLMHFEIRVYAVLCRLQFGCSCPVLSIPRFETLTQLLQAVIKVRTFSFIPKRSEVLNAILAHVVKTHLPSQQLDLQAVRQLMYNFLLPTQSPVSSDTSMSFVSPNEKGPELFFLSLLPRDLGGGKSVTRLDDEVVFNRTSFRTLSNVWYSPLAILCKTKCSTTVKPAGVHMRHS